MTPQLSVILSVYNQTRFLTKSINSILNQSFTDFEFIIVNDASTDDTLQILKNFTDPRLRFITHFRRSGLAGSLNQALAQSTGEYIARMDADDVAHKHRFKIQLDYLNHHPQAALCGTAVNLINLSGHKVGERHYPVKITLSLLMRYNPLIHPTIMARKSILLEIGDYDKSLNGAEDYDLWLRLGSRYQITNLDRVLLDYRINPTGISWSQLKHTELQAIKARLKALRHYNYPLWQVIFMVKPIFSYLIPSWIKKLLFNVK